MCWMRSFFSCSRCWITGSVSMVSLIILSRISRYVASCFSIGSGFSLNFFVLYLFLKYLRRGGESAGDYTFGYVDG